MSDKAVMASGNAQRVIKITIVASIDDDELTAKQLAQDIEELLFRYGPSGLDFRIRAENGE